MKYDDEKMRNLLLNNVSFSFFKFYTYTYSGLLSLTLAIALFFSKIVPIIIPALFFILAIVCETCVFKNRKEHTKFKYLSDPKNTYVLNSHIIDNEIIVMEDGSKKFFVYFGNNREREKFQVTKQEYPTYSIGDPVMIICDGNKNPREIKHGTYAGIVYPFGRL